MHARAENPEKMSLRKVESSKERWQNKNLVEQQVQL